MEPLVLQVGQVVPREYRMHPDLRYHPVVWLDDENRIVEMMSNAWMADVDLLYYRETFKIQRQGIQNRILPGHEEYVHATLQEMQQIIQSPELDNMSPEELAELVDRVWVPFWQELYEHLIFE